MRTVFSLSNVVEEFKDSLKLALPLVASEVIYALNGFIATIMVAHLGKEQLAANALVWSIYLVVILFFMGIICAVSIMVSQSFGAKDRTEISICFKQGLVLAIILSLPMMIMIWLSPMILVWTKQEQQVILTAKPFFYSLIWSMLPLNIWVVIQQFLIGITKTRVVVFMSVLAVPIEIFFYYAFLFGKFGMPQVGLAGIGYGLAASYFVGAFIFVGYLYFAKELREYSLFKQWWKIEYKFLLEMVKIGVPLGFMWCSEVLFFAVVAMMMGTLGVTVLAAYQISYQYLMVVLVILFALNQAVSVRVGNEVGRNNREKLKLATIVNLGIGLGLMALFAGFYLVFPEFAIGLDLDLNASNFKEVVVIAKRFLPIVAILLLVDCVRLVSCGALRGLKDSNVQLVISVFGFWGVAFPSAYLLAFKFGLGGVGIWWGIVIGLLITGVLQFIRFNRQANRVDLLSLVTKK